MPIIKAEEELIKAETVVETKSTGKSLVNQHFDFKGHAVRVIMQGKDPWFVGKDICDALGVKNSRQALSRLRDDEKDDVTLNDVIGRKQINTVVSESGLYKLILKSKKKAAEPFVDWVTREVLPTIRKTGAYMTDETLAKVTQDPAKMDDPHHAH